MGIRDFVDARYDAVNSAVAKHLATEPLLMPTFAGVALRLAEP